MRCLGSDCDYDVSAVTRELGRRRVRKAVKPLLRLLDNESNIVGDAAAEALGRIGDKSAVAPMLVYIENCETIPDLSAIALALGRIGDESAAAPMFEYLKQCGVGCLEEIDYSRAPVGCAQAMGLLRYQDAVATLVAMLDDERFYGSRMGGGVVEYHRAIVWALGQIGNPEAVDSLVRVVKKSMFSKVRGCAMVALGKIGVARAFDVLIEKLDERDNYKPYAFLGRIAAAEALGLLCDARAVESLISALDAKADGVSCASAISLAYLGDKRAVNPLKCMLNHEEEHRRITAALALTWFDEYDGLSILRHGISDTDTWYFGSHEGYGDIWVIELCKWGIKHGFRTRELKELMEDCLEREVTPP
jgi:HEAT repeat protein